MDNTPFTWRVRVYYEDTDLGGVVYYANYLKFFERARTEWLRHLGFEQDVLRQQENLIFVVRRLQVEYMQPARFNDELHISAQASQIKRASLVMQQTLWRGAACLCTAQVTLACLQADTLKPRAMPPSLWQAISAE